MTLRTEEHSAIGTVRPHKHSLVWGALGFIGRHLTEHLISLGDEVTVLCRNASSHPSPSWASQVRWVSFDSDEDLKPALREALQGVDTVYNLAGSSGAVVSNRSPLASLNANCEVQLQFLRACADMRTVPHVVFPSSRLVYGPTGRAPAAEDRLPSPQSMYAVHKLCIEHYLEVASYQGHITHTICRITNPYGFDPSSTGGGSYKILNLFVANAVSGEPITIFGDGSQLRDFIYISDVARWMALCGRLPAAVNQIFNIGTGASCTLREAAETIRRMTGVELAFKPWPTDYLAVESGDFVCDMSKARELLGVGSPVLLEDGLRQTMTLYRVSSQMPERVENALG